MAGGRGRFPRILEALKTNERKNTSRKEERVRNISSETSWVGSEQQHAAITKAPVPAQTGRQRWSGGRAGAGGLHITHLENCSGIKYSSGAIRGPADRARCLPPPHPPSGSLACRWLAAEVVVSGCTFSSLLRTEWQKKTIRNFGGSPSTTIYASEVVQAMGGTCPSGGRGAERDEHAEAPRIGFLRGRS